MTSAENKCPRCDRAYPAIKRKCPYCGARRSEKIQKKAKSDHSTARLIIAFALILVLVAATVAVLYISLSDGTGREEKKLSYDDNENITSIKGTAGDKKAPETKTENENRKTQPESEPQPEEPVHIQKVEIICFGSPTTDFTTDVGYSFMLKFRTSPDVENPECEWKSSDEAVFVIDQEGSFTATGHGTATLTLTVNDVSVDCVVRVN